MKSCSPDGEADLLDALSLRGGGAVCFLVVRLGRFDIGAEVQDDIERSGIGIVLWPEEEERAVGGSAAGAGGATAKDTERAAGEFVVAMCVAAAIFIPMGGLFGGLRNW